MHIFHKFNGFIITLILRSLGNKVGVSLRSETLNVFYRYGKNRKVSIGNNVFIGRGCRFRVCKNSELKIGDNVWFTGDTYLSCDQKVYIGNDTKIAEFCSIRDSNHGVVATDLIRNQAVSVEPIEISNDVWIGAGVRILKGSKIPQGAVIGANSVVLKTSNLENYGIYAGSPVKQINYRE